MLRTIWTGILVSMLSLSSCKATAGPQSTPVTIQGLGTIQLEQSSVSDSVTRTRLQCKTVEQAKVVQAKLYDDLTWDKLCGLQLLDAKSPLPILGRKNAPCLLIGRHDKAVYILSSPTAKALTDACNALKQKGETLLFVRIDKYPAILNFTDLSPLYMNVHQVGRKGDLKGQPRYSAKAMQAPYDFWQKYGINMGINLRTYMGSDNHIDNRPHTFPIENEMDHAEKRNMPYYIWIGPHQIPWWLRWQFPDDVAQTDPYAIPTWHPQGFLGGGNISMSASDEAFNYIHRYNLQMIERLKQHGPDQMSAIRLAMGRPGDELGLHLFSTELMDHSPAGLRGLRTWLQESRQLDLAGLGERWYGDKQRFTSWEQVQLPSLFSFFGDFGDDSFDLLTGWDWRPYQPQLDKQKWWNPSFNAQAAKWQQVDLAPSTDQLYAFGSDLDKTQRQGNSAIACMRKTFTADDWLAKYPQQRIYLVINSYSAKPVEVYLNGMDLGRHKAKQRWRGPVGLDVTSFLKSGKNTLAVRIPEGRILGPVFLTTHRPGYYPYDNPQKNARWVDMRDYLAQTLMDGYLRMVNPIRNQIADWPILLNVGSTFTVADHYLRVKQQAAIRAIHNTGAEASYRPWWPGLGYVIGTYGSSEESAQADATKLQRELGWLLFNAESAHSYIYNIALYQELDEKTGWFTKNKRLWQLLGKYIWRQPQVAIFRSPKGALYYPYQDEQHTWDLGRGSLQRVFYNNVYVTESELKAHLADDYPVVIDCNNAVLSQQAIDDLTHYVKQGGTYVVLQETGRHNPVHKDAWPIQQLTGCRVLGNRQNMMVRIPADSQLLPALAGQTFQGNGAAINWVGDNYAQNAVALEPTPEAAKQFTPIAHWEDGTIAAGVRKLGKGRVVVLGSTFWRSSSDRAGKGIYLQGGLESTFLRDLLAGLGLKPQVQTSNPDIWARRMITKNGSQQWMLLYNSISGPVKNVSMEFPLDRDPGVVMNVVTGEPAAYQYKNGQVTVSGLDFETHQTQVFGIWEKNFDQSVAQWYGIKAKFEKAPDVQGKPVIKIKDLPPAQMLVFDEFDFHQLLPDEQIEPQWLAGNPPSKFSRKAGHGFWDQMDLPATGKAVYRTTVNVPKDWQGRKLILIMSSWDGPIFLGTAKIYVNGKYVDEYREHGWNNNDSYDLTSYLQPGTNHLAFVVQSNNYRGGLIGQIGLYAQKRLEDVIEVKEVQLVQNAFKQKQVSIPMKKQKGRYLKFNVDIPADWNPKQTYIELSADLRSISTIRVNGRPVNYHQYLHPFPRNMQINLAPWIVPGQRNRIEVWPYASIPFHRDKALNALVDFDMQSIRLGTLTKIAAKTSPAPDPVTARKGLQPPEDRTIPAPTKIEPTDQQSQPSLIENGDFETFGTAVEMQVPDSLKRQRDVKAVQIADTDWIRHWQPGCQAYEKDAELSGKVAIDQTVHATGKSSLRIQNDKLTDITYVSYKPEIFGGKKVAVKPNHRYRLSWQVKGQNVKLNTDGPGPIMMMYYVTIVDGKQRRVNLYTRDRLKADFDWTKKQYDFTTKPQAQFAVFGFQLRRASGTVWYDDIKLEDLGPVAKVESF